MRGHHIYPQPTETTVRESAGWDSSLRGGAGQSGHRGSKRLGYWQLYRRHRDSVSRWYLSAAVEQPRHTRRHVPGSCEPCALKPRPGKPGTL
jgi:hypothetical protein